MREDLILAWAQKQGLVVTEEQLHKLARYQARVLEVNKYMNLTAITDSTDFAVKHIIDSLTLLRLVKPGVASLVDIGTGAGFPGLVLGIMRPDLRLTLLDSLQKRVNFLRETAEMLGVKAECVHARAQDYTIQHDYATARAVASLDKLATFALPLVKKGGAFLAMKSAGINEEIEKAKPIIEKHGGLVESVEVVEIASDIVRWVITISK